VRFGGKSSCQHDSAAIKRPITNGVKILGMNKLTLYGKRKRNAIKEPGLLPDIPCRYWYPG